MDKIKDINFNLVLGVAGGVEKVIEILISAYQHQKRVAVEKEQEAETEKLAHVETKGKLEELQKEHDDLKQKHEELIQTSTGLDTNKSVLV